METKHFVSVVNSTKKGQPKYTHVFFYTHVDSFKSVYGSGLFSIAGRSGRFRGEGEAGKGKGLNCEGGALGFDPCFSL